METTMSYQEGAPPSAGEAVHLENLSADGSDTKQTSSSSYKPLIDSSEGEYRGSKSFKVSEYDAPPTANAWWWQHPEIKQNWKAVLCSMVMLLVGILIMAAGIVFEVVHKEHVASVIFIVIGFLFFVPGLYHTVYIYLAAKGMRGFEMKQLSIFNMSR